jgi:hypothetical protein
MKTTKFKVRVCIIAIIALLKIPGFSQESILYKADSLRLANKPRLAIKTIKKLNGVKDGKYYQFLGTCYQNIYDNENKKTIYKLAKNNFQKCIEFEANNYVANCFLAEDFYNNASYQKSISSYKKALLDTVFFQKCNFFPTHIYGDLAIIYCHFDSLKKASYYFNKINTNDIILENNWYFKHWLYFNLKSNNQNDTILTKQVNNMFSKLKLTNLSDSIEAVSLIYFLNERINDNYPTWENNSLNDEKLNNIIKTINEKYNDTVFNKINKESCMLNFIYFTYLDLGILSSEDFTKYIKENKEKYLFDFYTRKIK